MMRCVIKGLDCKLWLKYKKFLNFISNNLATILISFISIDFSVVFVVGGQLNRWCFVPTELSSFHMGTFVVWLGVVTVL